MAKRTGNPTMKKDAVFVYSPDQLGYTFSEDHPFQSKTTRLNDRSTKEYGCTEETDIIPPRIATDEELVLTHDQKYIEIVKKAGNGEANLTADGESYGIGTEDTPMFPNMHEASALLVGGTLKRLMM